MAADIVPKLYEDIHKEFEKNIARNKWIQGFMKKLEDKKATSKDVAFYSAELGNCAGDALLKYIVPERLPDGKLYWNIAQRTIKPLFIEANKLVMAAAISVQAVADQKEKIGIKPVESELSPGRIDGFIRQLMEYWEEIYG